MIILFIAKICGMQQVPAFTMKCFSVCYMQVLEHTTSLLNLDISIVVASVCILILQVFRSDQDVGFLMPGTNANVASRFKWLLSWSALVLAVPFVPCSSSTTACWIGVCFKVDQEVSSCCLRI